MEARRETVTFRVFRYIPGDGEKGFRSYTLEVPEGTTVLEALHIIKEQHDPTLAWRSSCRMGVCGSCGMLINGEPRLACQTQVLHLGSKVVELRPMANYPVTRDLVPDLSSLFSKHAAISPHILRPDQREVDSPTGEFIQSPAELESYLQFSYCIKCGLCLAACPTVATDPDFLGPQALAQAYRYSADTRDGGLDSRRGVLDRFHGVFQCHMAGACSAACPKGVDPAFAIQLLKREVVLRGLGKRRRRLARVSPLPSEHVPSEKIPAAPPRTA